jgi:hypothetical protein
MEGTNQRTMCLKTEVSKHLQVKVKQILAIALGVHLSPSQSAAQGSKSTHLKLGICADRLLNYVLI